MPRKGDLAAIAAYLALLLALLLVLHHLVSPEQLPLLLVVVEGRSMVPTLWTGDIVFVVKAAPDEIKEGDIIVYHAISDGHLVIHRVVKVNRIGDNYYYVTKGDNNMLPDNMMPSLEPATGIPYSRVVGVVVSIEIGGRSYVLRLPLLGYLSIMASSLK